MATINKESLMRLLDHEDTDQCGDSELESIDAIFDASPESTKELLRAMGVSEEDRQRSLRQTKAADNLRKNAVRKSKEARSQDRIRKWRKRMRDAAAANGRGAAKMQPLGFRGLKRGTEELGVRIVISSYTGERVSHNLDSVGAGSIVVPDSAYESPKTGVILTGKGAGRKVTFGPATTRLLPGPSDAPRSHKMGIIKKHD